MNLLSELELPAEFLILCLNVALASIVTALKGSLRSATTVAAMDLARSRISPSSGP